MVSRKTLTRQGNGLQSTTQPTTPKPQNVSDTAPLICASLQQIQDELGTPRPVVTPICFLGIGDVSGKAPLPGQRAR